MVTVQEDAMKTLREWLADMGVGNFEAIAGLDWLGDVPIASAEWLATPGTSDLQFICGGEGLISFTPIAARRQVWLVVDESPTWQWRSAAQDGPKPHKKLRLVQTA
jgi:hypothetical protein